jgi:phage-related protein
MREDAKSLIVVDVSRDVLSSHPAADTVDSVNDPLRAIKPTVFVGSSKKDLRAFPVAVRSEIGQSLFEAQLGERPRNAKPLKGFSGVLENRDNFDGDTYRTVYTTRLEGVLYVLHAFQKKSTSGIATPQSTST